MYIFQHDTDVLCKSFSPHQFYIVSYSASLSSHHSRGLSGHFDGVSPVGDGHFTPVHDVQAGIQDSEVELEKYTGVIKNAEIRVETLDCVLFPLYLSIVPVPLRDVIVGTVVDDPHLAHHTLLPLCFIVQEHGVG